MLHLVLTHKVRHIANTGATEGINALVIVAYCKHCATVLRHGACKLFDPCVLQFVGILELVNQNVTEAATVVLSDGIVIAQEFVRAQHQFTKIHHALALALGFVEFIQLYFFTGIGVTHIYIFGSKSVLFAPSNKPHGLLRWKTFFVHLKLFA